MLTTYSYYLLPTTYYLPRQLLLGEQLVLLGEERRDVVGQSLAQLAPPRRNQGRGAHLVRVGVRVRVRARVRVGVRVGLRVSARARVGVSGQGRG